jgi:hypothetical protein
MSFLKSFVKAAGSVVHVTASVALAPSKLAGKAVSKIPVVGKPLSSVVNIANAPLRLADSIAQGNRLDKAVIGNIKSQIKDVKEVAPYAQMVITIVPGVGTIAGGAIGAGIALASGQPIDEALIKGVKGALPGGVIAASIFDASQAVLSGKPLAQIGIAALPIDSAQKKALEQTMSYAKDIASGKKISEVALNAVQKNLPADIKKAASIGLAIAQAASVQQKMIQNVTPAVLNQLSTMGMQLINADPVLKAGFGLVKDTEQQKGFKVCAAIIHFTVKPMEVAAIRNKLTSTQKKGFDLCAAAHVGAVKAAPKPVPKVVSGPSGIKAPVRQITKPVTGGGPTVAQAKAQFAANATQGMVGTSDALKKNVIATVVKDPAALAGTKAAVAQIAATKKKDSWWHRLLVNLGWHK